MLSQLDDDCLPALMGHEFGHHLTHTRAVEQTPRQRTVACASATALDLSMPRVVRVLASRLWMAKEFTTDRFAALATGSLEAPLRLMMSVVSGCFVRAPIILHPFSLAADSRRSGSYPLKHRDDDTATANQAFVKFARHLGESWRKQVEKTG